MDTQEIVNSDESDDGMSLHSGEVMNALTKSFWSKISDCQNEETVSQDIPNMMMSGKQDCVTSSMNSAEDRTMVETNRVKLDQMSLCHYGDVSVNSNNSNRHGNKQESSAVIKEHPEDLDEESNDSQSTVFSLCVRSYSTATLKDVEIIPNASGDSSFSPDLPNSPSLSKKCEDKQIRECDVESDDETVLDFEESFFPYSQAPVLSHENIPVPETSQPIEDVESDVCELDISQSLLEPKNRSPILTSRPSSQIASGIYLKEKTSSESGQKKFDKEGSLQTENVIAHLNPRNSASCSDTKTEIGQRSGAMIVEDTISQSSSRSSESKEIDVGDLINERHEREMAALNRIEKKLTELGNGPLDSDSKLAAVQKELDTISKVMKQLRKVHCQERERITAELNVVYDAEQKNKYKKQIQLICIRQRKLGQCFRLHAQISMKWRKTKRNLPEPTPVQSIQKRSLPRSVPITCVKENELETVRKKMKEIPLDVSKRNEEKSKEPMVIYLQPNSRQPQEEVMPGKLHGMAQTNSSDLSFHQNGTQAVTIPKESYTSAPSMRATPGSKPVFPSHMDSHKISSNSAIAPSSRAPVADSAPKGMLQTSSPSSISSEIVFSEPPLGIGATCNGVLTATAGISSAPNSSSHGSKNLPTEQGKSVLASTQNSHAIPPHVTPDTSKVNLTTLFPPTAELPSSVPTVSAGNPLVLLPESRLSLSDKQTKTAGTGQPTTVTVSTVQQQITSVACNTTSTSGYTLPPVASKPSASYLLSAEILNPHNKNELSQYQSTNTKVTGATSTAATVTLSSSLSAVKPAAFPTLKELIESNVITPEPNSMFIIMPNKKYVASLLPSGQIQGAGGETFKTPTQWCSALLPVPVRKSTAYQRVFYKSKPLSSYKIPIPPLIQDNRLQPLDQQPETLNADCSEKVTPAPPTQKVYINTQAAYYPGTKENVEERPGLHNLLRKCTICLIGTEELLPSDSYLPADFWTVDRFQDVTLSQDLIAEIDEW